MHKALRSLGTTLSLMTMALGLSCAPGPDESSAPEDRPVTVRAFRGTAVELAELLHGQGVPVSIIQSPVDPTIDLDERRIGVQALLEKVVRMTGVYRLESIDGRLVLYPPTLPFDREMKAVRIEGEPRFGAAVYYLRLVRERVPELPLIAGPGMATFGPTGYTPLYDDPVTLKPDARIIDHLVQLFGPNRNLYFVVRKDPGLTQPPGAVLIMMGSTTEERVL